MYQNIITPTTRPANLVNDDENDEVIRVDEFL